MKRSDLLDDLVVKVATSLAMTLKTEAFAILDTSGADAIGEVSASSVLTVQGYDKRIRVTLAVAEIEDDEEDDEA